MSHENLEYLELKVWNEVFHTADDMDLNRWHK